MRNRWGRCAALGLLCFVAGGASAESRRTVAVLPVVVNASGDEGYLQSGVADMLASRLGQTPGVAVIRVTDPAAATNDVGAAQEAGRAVGAEYVLFGSFTRFGEGASLDVRCAGVNQDAGEVPKAVFIQSGTLGDIIPRIDALAEKVGRYVTRGETGQPVASGSDGAGEAVRSELQALRDRVDALEASVQSLEDAASAAP